MLAKKKKLSKKQIKEDKLITTYYKVIKFYEEYQSKIMIGIGAAAVVVIAIVFFNNKAIEDNKNAAVELSRVMQKFNEGSYQEAIDGVPGTNIIGFKRIVSAYGGTDQGEIAKLFLANSYSYLGNHDEALKYYEDYSGSNLIYKASALAGEASCYGAKGEYEKAAELFGEAASVYENETQNAEYLLNSGISYLKAGNNRKAKVAFEKVKNEYSTSASARQVDRFMARIN